MKHSHPSKVIAMPPTMQPMIRSRTKRSRMYKGFESVNVGPLRLYFSQFELIGFESDKTKVVVCVSQGPASAAPSSGKDEHRLVLEPDDSKWLSAPEFSPKWTELSHTYFK